MPTCPQCDHAVSDRAVVCPTCQLVLKAHGHPGIDLYRAAQDTYLCEFCTYQQDDSCTFPQRPTATTCTLYQDVRLPMRPQPSDVYKIPWWRQYAGWLIVSVLVVASIALVVL